LRIQTNSKPPDKFEDKLGNNEPSPVEIDSGKSDDSVSQEIILSTLRMSGRRNIT
jgi:hypothetical protein